MEFKIIFWIIVGIVWLVGNLWKKIKKASGPEAKKAPEPLFSEFKKSAQSDIQGKVITKDSNVYQKRDKVLKQRNTVQSKTNQYAKPSSSKVKEVKNTPAIAIDDLGIPIKKYRSDNYDSNVDDEETVILKKTQKDREKAMEMKKRGTVDQHAPMYFEPYSEQTSSPSRILHLLRNPEDLKNSIVLAEILQRKF